MPDLKFSVVVPVYNRGLQVKQAIESVLSQEYTSFELIVVDDGSTDDTAQVIKSFSDPRLVYLYQENKERGAARNNGWNRATGDFITFLDSDDEFLPYHLFKTAEFIRQNPDYEMYCTAYLKEISGKSERIYIPDRIYESLANGNFLSCNGVFISAGVRNFRFSEQRQMSGLEDWLLWLQISKNKTAIGAQLFTTKMNHHNQRSVLQTEPVAIENRFEHFFSELEKIHSDDVSFPINRIRASGESYMALHLALTKQYRKEARSHLRKSLILRPGQIFTRRYFAILKHLWF